MNGKQLKNSILQWAIQGKLVPQDPNDEPASVLLERICEEKKRLIKEGKIKKDKNESFIFKGDDNSYYEKFADGKVVCIDEEIPFEIPAGWEWERWGHISLAIQYGYNAPAEQAGNARMVRISDIQNNKLVWDTVPYCTIPDKDIDTYLLAPDDILFARTGGTVGKSFLVEDSRPNTIYAGYLIRTRYNSHELCPKYLKAYMDSQLYWDQLHEGTIATAQPNCNGQTLSRMLLPIPPHSEQIRITRKLSEIEPVIEAYKIAQERLDTLNCSVTYTLKKSILQEAIQGKLVSQDSADEPATTLLERISEEKQILVKAGKIKAKDAITSTIFKGDDNKYYEKVGTNIACLDEVDLSEIPENWAYTRLGSLITLLSGRDLEPSQYNACEMGIPYITGASNINCGIQVNRWTTSPVTVSNAGDLLITCKGTVGTMAFNNIGDIHIARQIMAIRSTSLNMQYLQYYLESQLTSLRKQAHSMIPGISREDILSLIIPLPPIQEQQRIVDKVKSLYEKVG